MSLIASLLLSTTVSAAAMAGYADSGGSLFAGDVNPYRYGLGIRAGATFSRLYVGATFLQHFGTSTSARGEGSLYEGNYRRALFGVELGYDAPIGEHLTLRPFMSVGASHLTSKTTAGDVTLDDSGWSPMLGPGLSTMYRIEHLLFGVDLRSALVPLTSPRQWALGPYLTLGYAF